MHRCHREGASAGRQRSAARLRRSVLGASAERRWRSLVSGSRGVQQHREQASQSRLGNTRRLSMRRIRRDGASAELHRAVALQAQLPQGLGKSKCRVALQAQLPQGLGKSECRVALQAQLPQGLGKSEFRVALQAQLPQGLGKSEFRRSSRSRSVLQHPKHPSRSRLGNTRRLRMRRIRRDGASAGLQRAFALQAQLPQGLGKSECRRLSLVKRGGSVLPQRDVYS